MTATLDEFTKKYSAPLDLDGWMILGQANRKGETDFLGSKISPDGVIRIVVITPKGSFIQDIEGKILEGDDLHGFRVAEDICNQQVVRILGIWSENINTFSVFGIEIEALGEVFQIYETVSISRYIDRFDLRNFVVLEWNTTCYDAPAVVHGTFINQILWYEKAISTVLSDLPDDKLLIVFDAKGVWYLQKPAFFDFFQGEVDAKVQEAFEKIPAMIAKHWRPGENPGVFYAKVSNDLGISKANMRKFILPSLRTHVALATSTSE